MFLPPSVAVRVAIIREAAITVAAQGLWLLFVRRQGIARHRVMAMAPIRVIAIMDTAVFALTDTEVAMTEAAMVATVSEAIEVMIVTATGTKGITEVAIKL